MSFRVCFPCGKAWYCRGTSEYLEKKDEGVICDHDHYSYSHRNKHSIPNKVRIVREKGESW